MPILKISEQLLKLSEEKMRLPAPVLPGDSGPCPACQNPTWGGAVCAICGYVGQGQEQAFESYQEQQMAQQKQAASVPNPEDYNPGNCPGCGSGTWSGVDCKSCNETRPPREFMHPIQQRPKGQEHITGYDPSLKVVAWENNPKNPDYVKPKKKKKSKSKKAFVIVSDDKDTDLGEAQNAPNTRMNEAENDVLEMNKEQQQTQDKQGARMSRFDDELIHEAAVPGIQYDQTSTMYLDGPFGLTQQAPASVAEGHKDIYDPRFLDVTDLDASATDAMGGPGSNAVWVRHPGQMDDGLEMAPEDQGIPAAFQQPGVLPYNVDNNLGKNASVEYPGVEETLYRAYEASRDLRKDLKNSFVADFSDLGSRLAAIVTDLRSNDTVRTSARQNIGEAKLLIKFASEIEEGYIAGADPKNVRKSLKQLEERLSSMSVTATNGNQETNYQTQVQNLDDVSGPFDRNYIMTPDSKSNVLVPNVQPNQLALADVPDYYNDGGETGFGLAYNFHREPWPNDGTNPALVPDQQMQMQAAVQAGKEKILDAIEVVDRLERLGMVTHEDRAKHIAKFEQMSDAKLAGFKASIDMLEESGARQPRSQKVASGANRLPEMGRLTTASTVSPTDAKSDDFLMTL